MRLGDAFRFNAKPCKTCGARFSVFAKVVARLCGPLIRFHGDYMWETSDGRAFNQSPESNLIFTCTCGARRIAIKVLGKYNAGKKCDGRCLAATGFNCECACKGKNHGAGHEAHA